MWRFRRHPVFFFGFFAGLPVYFGHLVTLEIYHFDRTSGRGLVVTEVLSGQTL